MGFAGYLATFFENASWVAAEACRDDVAVLRPLRHLGGDGHAAVDLRGLGGVCSDRCERGSAEVRGRGVLQPGDRRRHGDRRMVRLVWLDADSRLFRGSAGVPCLHTGRDSKSPERPARHHHRPLLHHRDGDPHHDTLEAERRPEDLAIHRGQVIGRTGGFSAWEKTCHP